jgi:hypothetical protein
MTSHFSDLEAVHGSQQPGLEAVRDLQQPGLEFNSKTYGDQNHTTLPPSPRMLCGLTPKALWIVVAIISVLVIGAAVGGAIGATKSYKSSSNPNQNPISTPTSTTVKLTPSLTTTPVVGPSATLLRDCPSSNGTLFTSSPNRSNPQSFLKFCSATIIRAPSIPIYVLVVNVRTTSLDDCIGLCATYNEANKTTIDVGADYVCNAVCWRNGFVDDDQPGACFGFTTVNSTESGGVLGNFQLVSNATSGGSCDSAGWIDQRKLA